MRRDFNIEDEAGGAGIPVILPFNASVTDNILEIRFYWAGKGTTRFPRRGVYGPLVSAIDVNPYFKVCSIGGKKTNKFIFIGVGIGVPCLILLVLVILWRKKCFKRRRMNDKGEYITCLLTFLINCLEFLLMTNGYLEQILKEWSSKRFRFP